MRRRYLTLAVAVTTVLPTAVACTQSPQLPTTPSTAEEAAQTVRLQSDVGPLAQPTPPPNPGEIVWLRQFGTSEIDNVDGVAATGNGVFLSGLTGGSLQGRNKGFLDAFVRRYDANGRATLTKQFGTTGSDTARDIAFGPLGPVVGGETSGTLGQASFGGGDAYLIRLRSNGLPQWTQQFGSSGLELLNAVATDNSAVYGAGATFGNLAATNAGSEDSFVTKRDAAGNFIWTQQFGTSGADQVLDVAVDGSGNVYVCGVQNDDDAFVSKFNSAGILLWTNVLSSPDLNAYEEANGIAINASGVFVVGLTGGDLIATNAGSGTDDVWVQRLDPTTGAVIWSDQFGTAANDDSTGGTADDSGFYLTGHTLGDLEATSAGSFDVFVRKYANDTDINGDPVVVWSNQFGTPQGDLAPSVSVDSQALYLGGTTGGTFPGQKSAGDGDGFVARIAK